MKKYLSLIPLVFLLCFVVGCQQQVEEVAEEPAVDIAAEVEAIHAMSDEFLAAAKDKDIDRLMAVMADDVVKMATNDTFFEDREGVKEFFLRFFERGIDPDWEVSKVEVAKSCELAYALFKLDFTSVNEDQTVSHYYSGTFQILEKQTDGNWKIVAFY